MITIMRVAPMSGGQACPAANRLSGDYNPARVLPGRRVSGPASDQALRFQADSSIDDDAVGHCLSVPQPQT